VGESTTSAVVISLVLIFVLDFFLSYLFFQVRFCQGGGRGRRGWRGDGCLSVACGVLLLSLMCIPGL